MALLLPSDTGTMNKDKSKLHPQGDTGVETIVFGIDASDSKITQIVKPPDTAKQGDCRKLNADQLADVALVICTLFAMPQDQHNDAISVIDVLVSLGYRGDVIVLAPPLLRPKMVESELRNLSSGMTLRLLAGALPPLTQV